MNILHHAPDNASLLVRLALEELELAYVTRLVDRRLRARDTPAYRRLNPAGLIPALETPDGALFETGAILLWLSKRHGAMAPAPGAADRDPFPSRLFFVSNRLRADMGMHFHADRYAESEAALPAVRAAMRSRIAGHPALLDGMAAGRPARCRPGATSVLACYLGALFRWLALCPEDGTDWIEPSARPALQALAAAMQTRTAALRAAIAEGLGHTIFTGPASAAPTEGIAT